MTTPERQDSAKAAAPGQQRGRIPSDTFTNRLILARILAGMTIQEAATAAGLDRSSWQNWERGRRPRDVLDVAQRIAEALDIDHEWLLFGGPLTPARGRPTNRSGESSTHRYRDRVAERPKDNRPTGRAGKDAPVSRPPDLPRRSRRISGPVTLTSHPMHSATSDRSVVSVATDAA